MILRRSLLAGLTALLTPWSALAAPSRKKEVLAFYYGWYGPNAHWSDAGAIDTPAAGHYDSLDAAVITRQVTEIKNAGITGLISSWWGKGDATGQQLIPLLEAAEKAGISVTAYLENADTADALADQLIYLHQAHTAHAAWLKLDGKPVIFLYDRVLQTLGLDGYNAARAKVENRIPDAFAYITTGNGRGQIAQRAPFVDGVHIYDMPYYLAQDHPLPWLWRRQFYNSWLKYQKGLRVTTATIMPGFDDHLVPGRPAPRPIVDRDKGRLFRDLWRAAMAANPDWILIVSYNEWHEGSQLEPSLENGTRELDTCREMSALFRA